jgi:hypothetical protein
MVGFLGRALSRIGHAAFRARHLPDREEESVDVAFFEENGYLVLPGFFDRERITTLKAHLDPSHNCGQRLELQA